jgi:hypothetical protein
MRELVGCALLAGAVALAACTSITGSSTSSALITTYAPVTGIEVDADNLFERLGCGHGPGIAFKYVVVVFQTDIDLMGNVVRHQIPSPDGGLELAPPLAISTTDCFADAVFENLAGAAVGATTAFSLDVDVFDDVTYDRNVNAVTGSTASTCQCNLQPTPPIQCGSDDCATLIRGVANWTTTCTVRQQPSIQSIAACDVLVATGN